MKALKQTLASLYSPLSRFLHERWALLFPVWYAGYVFQKNNGRRLNLREPGDYNEKIQWLKLYSDTSLWTELADKYKVREYVKSCGLGDHLTRLYGVWENADDIDFDMLPDSFVLKTNHRFERIIIVKDKSKLDPEKARNLLNTWLRERFGLVSFEPHYWYIERRILAEALLEDDYNASHSSSLIDYKFYCLNGEPFVVEALYDRKLMVIGDESRREGPRVKACAFDLEWNPRPDIYVNQPDEPPGCQLPRPSRFEEMKRICRILSKPFPQVRVDLYEVHNRVYFGELTFTPGGGKDVFTPDFFKDMGKAMDLPVAEGKTKDHRRT